MNEDNTPKRARGRPFPKLKSGNPKGRPKGARNEADVLHENLTKSVGRGADKRTVAGLIILQQYRKASRGDHPALSLIFDIRAKLGLGDEIRAADREAKVVRLPRPPDEEEFDLRIAPAREKERQFYKMLLDRNDVPGRHVPEIVQSGDDAWENGDYDGALRFYLQQATESEDESHEVLDDPVEYIPTPRMNNNWVRALARVGLLADYLLKEREYALAIECADAALRKDPGLTWIALIQAHARMFLGRTEEARSFYCSFRGQKNAVVTHWENLILQDFAEFRKRDQIVPLMAEVEASLREQGWSTTGLHRKAGSGSRPEGMLSHEQEFARLNPRHLETAAIYAKHRKFEEAAEVYRYLIRKDRAAIGQGLETRAGDLELAEIQFSQLARILLFEGSFGFALECIAELSPQTMERLPVQATYAHLLLMSNRVPEAEAIYRRHRGKVIGGKIWELAMLEDLQHLRARARSTHASLRLEKQFEEEGMGPSMAPRAESDEAPLRFSRPAEPKEPTLRERSDLRAGEELFGAGQIDDALAVYRRVLASTAKRCADGILTGQQRIERQEAADRIADIAFCYLLDHKVELGRDLCSEALQAVPSAARPSIRQAHAFMLLGDVPAAKSVYEKHLNDFAAPDRPWAAVLIQEFQQLRDVGLQHPLMTEIEAMLQQRNQSGIGKLMR